MWQNCKSIGSITIFPVKNSKVSCFKESKQSHYSIISLFQIINKNSLIYFRLQEKQKIGTFNQSYKIQRKMRQPILLNYSRYHNQPFVDQIQKEKKWNWKRKKKKCTRYLRGLWPWVTCGGEMPSMKTRWEELCFTRKMFLCLCEDPQNLWSVRFLRDRREEK